MDRAESDLDDLSRLASPVVPDCWREVTYDGRASRATNNVMKVLVILTIALVAYWAATGGLDRIATPETAISTTATTVTE